MYRYNKFNNTKVEVDGIKFDSKKESERYLELKLLEKDGIIKNLVLQPKFILQNKYEYRGQKIREIDYKADFMYELDNETVVEDVKSWITQKDKVYRLKKKLLLFRYPDIKFIEVL